MISGIDGGNCILSSMAKERAKSGLLKQAHIYGKKAHTPLFSVVLSGKVNRWF